MEIRYHIETWVNFLGSNNQQMFIGSFLTEEAAIEGIEKLIEADVKSEDKDRLGYYYKVIKTYTNPKNENWLRPAK